MVIRCPLRSQLIPVNLSLMLDRAEMSSAQFTSVPEVVQPSGPGGGADTMIVCVSSSVAPSLSVTVSVTVKSVVGLTTA
jgi:tripartite-type tricarboxylate transporter receptor subunit TctC